MQRSALPRQSGSDSYESLWCYIGGPQSALARIEAIVAALQLLKSSPLIGRSAADDQRQLVISVGAGGYVAPYAYAADEDLVRVVALRSQRKRGYRTP